jgi:hypothetical protein
MLALFWELDANRRCQKQNRYVVDAPKYVDAQTPCAVQLRIGGGVDKDSEERPQSRKSEGQDVAPLDKTAAAR